MSNPYRGTLSIIAVGLIIIPLLMFAKILEPKAQDSVSPVFNVELPPGYRDWRVVSVAHESGNNNDIRAILGNDVAIQAFRNGVRPFPDGTILVRLAYQHVASDQNNAIFGRFQSFVAGAPTNVQVSVKDSKKYASTTGWGYGQLKMDDPTQALS